MKVLFFSLFASFFVFFSSCNQLNRDVARKSGLSLATSGEAVLATGQADTAPDSLAAFFWPSEEFFHERQRAGELSSDLDYQTYIAQVSSTVFFHSDEYDKWALEFFEQSPGIKSRLALVAEDKKVVLSKIKAWNQETKALRAELKSLKREIKNLNKEIASSGQEKKELEEKVQALKNAQREKTARGREVSGLKRAYEKEELAPLKKREKALQDQLDHLSEKQGEQVKAIQKSLDPQAVLTDDIDPLAQVNWVQAYQETAGQENLFDFSSEEIRIRLGEWGRSGRVYETGSTIYDVSFSELSVLKFKFRERDEHDNETGRIFEFELQYSPFGPHSRLVGDMMVTVGGEVVRRGQMKVVFLTRQQ